MTTAKRPVWLAEEGRGWDHIRIHARVLFHPDLSAHDIRVYGVIAWHAEVESGDATQGQPTLARESDCSDRQVRKSVAVLEAAKLLVVIRPPGKATVYRLTPPPKVAIRVPRNLLPESKAKALDAEEATPPRNDVPPRQQVPPRNVVPPRKLVPETPERASGVPRNVVPHNNKRALETSLNPSLLPTAAEETGSSSQPPTPTPDDKAQLQASIVEILDLDPGDLTKSARGALSNAVSQLLEVGATPEQVRRRAGQWPLRFKGATLTPSALAKHWATLNGGAGPAGELPEVCPHGRRQGFRCSECLDAR